MLHDECYTTYFFNYFCLQVCSLRLRTPQDGPDPSAAPRVSRVFMISFSLSLPKTISNVIEAINKLGGLSLARWTGPGWLDGA